MTGSHMSNNVIDVLMYLFSHYMDDESGPEPDRDDLVGVLREAGFEHGEIDRAFVWLDGLVESEAETPGSPGRQSLRVYCDEELQRLDVECRGFLLYLEHSGILTPTSREVVIGRVMALDEDEAIDLERLKWVVMMVLSNQPGEELAFAKMEDLVFEDSVGYMQ